MCLFPSLFTFPELTFLQRRLSLSLSLSRTATLVSLLGHISKHSPRTTHSPPSARIVRMFSLIGIYLLGFLPRDPQTHLAHRKSAICASTQAKQRWVDVNIFFFLRNLTQSGGQPAGVVLFVSRFFCLIGSSPWCLVFKNALPRILYPCPSPQTEASSSLLGLLP